MQKLHYNVMNISNFSERIVLKKIGFYNQNRVIVLSHPRIRHKL